MFYVLDKRFRLRGWKKVPYALFDTEAKEPVFIDKKKFSLISKCDGVRYMDPDKLPEYEKKLLLSLLKHGIVREAGFGESLSPEQEYKLYPCRYKKDVHWSVTGQCNLKCRHCFMSAPSGKHGAPSFDRLMGIMEQFSECGIAQVGITGGEPLIRSDFLDIVKELTRREIGINCIFTNGWLVDESLLDSLEAIGVKPPFQLSYDGVGQHDFLRGIEGAEERVLNALRLLQKRGYTVSVSACMHRKNIHTIRETVKLMASLGVDSLKLGSMMELGEWAEPDLRELHLSPEEQLAAFEKYIPEFFEDGAPLSIMLAGTFCYDKENESWSFNAYRPCPAKWESQMLSCPSVKKGFYLGADGMVAPCMGMCDCDFAQSLPNVYETPLREILGDSRFMELCSATVGEVRDGNDKCRSCEHTDKCSGGCRNSALIKSNNYYGVDPEVCFFYENGWYERLKSVTEPCYTEHCMKNGLEVKKQDGPKDDADKFC